MEAKITILTSAGKYDWCGNGYQNPGSGFYLCKNEVNKFNESTYQYMVSINAEMSLELLDSIDLIEIYDASGFLAYYTIDKLISTTNQIFFALKYVKPGTNLSIRFQKIQPKLTDKSIFSRPPMKTMYQSDIEIPQLKPFNNDCPICTERVVVDDTQKDVYVSKCQHAFHHDCILSYAESKYTVPLHENCILFKCTHSLKTIPFPCPICRTTLEDHHK